MTNTLFDTNRQNLKNRHELVFVYDVKYSNPNGDPTENNELRMIGDKCFVTDTRLKRTIRDYIDEANLDKDKFDIFVKEKVDNTGKVIDVKWRLKETLWISSEKDIKPEHINQLIDKFIDIRLFWSAIKMKLTWPVQFNFGESMHKVEMMKIQWTTVFSSWENKWQWTFTEMFITPYAIISFHWIANDIASQKTWMDEEDFELLKDAIWNGTKNLITRSKFEQLPRLLIDVKFKEWVKTHIWELDKYIKLIKNENIIDEKAISDIEDVIFDFEKFVERIQDFKDIIENIEIRKDKRVKIKNLPESIENISIEIKEI
jgi:CRISPR-associated protein Csh2